MYSNTVSRSENHTELSHQVVDAKLHGDLMQTPFFPNWNKTLTLNAKLLNSILDFDVITEQYPLLGSEAPDRYRCAVLLDGGPNQQQTSFEALGTVSTNSAVHLPTGSTRPWCEKKEKSFDLLYCNWTQWYFQSELVWNDSGACLVKRSSFAVGQFGSQKSNQVLSCVQNEKTETHPRNKISAWIPVDFETRWRHNVPSATGVRTLTHSQNWLD